MNVVYDISALGLSFYNQRARTGVARVIERLAYHLHPLLQRDLSFCAFQSPGHLLQTIRYLKNENSLGKLHFQYPEPNAARAVVLRLAQVYPAPGTNRTVIRGLNTLISSLGAMLQSPGSTSLAMADIFHSTFYPFPRGVQSSSRLRRFITVYDLIPILHPNFFQFREDHLIHQVIDSISPDDWVVAISQNTKNDLCGYKNLDPNRVHVTPLAAGEMFYRCTDPDRLAIIRARYGIPEGRYVLSLGTLEPRKNIDRTIRSFADVVLQQRLDDLNLVLVGTKGWDFESIFDAIENTSSLRNQIVVTGFVPDEDLAPLYSGSTMFVYPSHYEGFGLPPLEAMQCGVPVITSNTSSLPEVVGDSGIMVSPRDSDALSEAMYTLYTDVSLRDSLAEKGLQRSKQFSWDRCAQQTVAAYQQALV